MKQTSAMILFAHGARDPRWASPFIRLQKLTQDSLPEVRVELSFLEFMQPNLSDLVATLVQDGCEKVTVAPIFLGQGGHVLRDLPVLIANLRETYPELNLQQIEAVGENQMVLQAISDYCVSFA